MSCTSGAERGAMTRKGPGRRHPAPSEYDVAFAIKEWLIEHDWNVIAFNPPGSQGTFSIPNPSKDPLYKGQIGTEAPDIIAIKGDHLLITECKDYRKPRILSDVEKLSRLISNKERMRLLYTILKKACIANDVRLPDDFHLLTAVGYGGQLLVAETRKKYMESLKLLKSATSDEIQNFFIEVTDPGRNTASMDASADPLTGIKTTLYSTECDIEDVLLCGSSK